MKLIKTFRRKYIMCKIKQKFLENSATLKLNIGKLSLIRKI